MTQLAPLSEITKMHTYYQDGHSLKQTAREFHYCWKTVWRYFKLYDLPMRGKREAAYIHWQKRGTRRKDAA